MFANNSYVQQSLSARTQKQRQLIPGIIADLSQALDRVREIVQSPRPEYEQWNKAIVDVQLHVGRLATEAGAHNVPEVLRGFSALAQHGLHGPGSTAWALEIEEKAQQRLTEIRDSLAECPHMPETPTSEFCLLSAYRVRWHDKGNLLETKLQPMLWHVFEFLLGQEHYPISCEVLEYAVWREESIRNKTLNNTISRLNNALELIKFPWEWRVRNNHISRQG